jgi:hypothetical protein
MGDAKTVNAGGAKPVGARDASAGNAKPVVARDASAPPPSLARQKTYIVENGDILNLATRKSILRIVLMDIGNSAADEQCVIIKNQASADVSLNLDNIDNPDVILHIFNIVSNRRASLNEPANISGW